MALLDFLKKKKDPKKWVAKTKKEERPTKVKKVVASGEIKEKEEVKVEEKKKAARQEYSVGKAITGTAWRTLRRPHVTEKATMLVDQNQYAFEVWSGANKVNVKRAVEGVYNVDVLSVRMINIPPKRRRRGRVEGWKGGYKKAIVRVKEGQKIEVLPR